MLSQSRAQTGLTKVRSFFHKLENRQPLRWVRPYSRPKWWLRTTALLLLALSILGTIGYERYLALSNVPPEALPVLSLDEYQRIAVFAPHCDDEVLGAGGLIQAALQKGLDVYVVVATGGDGYRRATTAQFRRIFPQPRDFVTMGEIRQQETLAALAHLGLDSSKVIFLGYPERGLAALWWQHWDIERPYRSPFSHLTRVPYTRALRPGAPYSGQMLLMDVRNVLNWISPDVIVMPDPLDEHPDHRALSAFVALAVEIERTANPAFQPDLLGYLVHYGLYPQPFAMRPNMGLVPPRRLVQSAEWLQFPLSAEELARKRAALEEYHSQQRIIRYYLQSFVRRNELFVRVDPVVSLNVVEQQGFLDTDAPPSLEEYLAGRQRGDPLSDRMFRRIAAAADIRGLAIFRLGNTVWVKMDLRGRVSRPFTYHLYVRTYSENGSQVWQAQYRHREREVVAHGDSIWYRLDLDTLDDPQILLIAAETRWGTTVDQTAWYVVRLEDSWIDQLAAASEI